MLATASAQVCVPSDTVVYIYYYCYYYYYYYYYETPLLSVTHGRYVLRQSYG